MNIDENCSPNKLESSGKRRKTRFSIPSNNGLKCSARASLTSCLLFSSDMNSSSDGEWAKYQAELRESNFLTGVKANVLKLKYTDNFKGDYREEMEFLMENKGRNKILQRKFQYQIF